MHRPKQKMTGFYPIRLADPCLCICIHLFPNSPSVNNSNGNGLLILTLPLLLTPYIPLCHHDHLSNCQTPSPTTRKGMLTICCRNSTTVLSQLRHLGYPHPPFRLFRHQCFLTLGLQAHSCRGQHILSHSDQIPQDFEEGGVTV